MCSWSFHNHKKSAQSTLGLEAQGGTYWTQVLNVPASSNGPGLRFGIRIHRFVSSGSTRYDYATNLLFFLQNMSKYQILSQFTPPIKQVSMHNQQQVRLLLAGTWWRRFIPNLFIRASQCYDKEFSQRTLYVLFSNATIIHIHGGRRGLAVGQPLWGRTHSRFHTFHT